MTDDCQIPGLFTDEHDFAAAFKSALDKLPVAELSEFHRKLAAALDASLKGNARAFSDLALGLVMCERLSSNLEYKRAVKEIDELGTPDSPIDHRRLISSLRAAR